MDVKNKIYFYTIKNIFHLRPSNTKNLEKIDMFPYAKINTVGVVLIDKINSFCKKFNIAQNDFEYQYNEQMNLEKRSPIKVVTNFFFYIYLLVIKYI